MFREYNNYEEKYLIDVCIKGKNKQVLKELIINNDALDILKEIDFKKIKPEHIKSIN